MTQSAKMWSLIASLEQSVGIVRYMPCCLEAAGLRWPGVKPGLPMGQIALLCLQSLVSHVTTQDQLQARASSSRFTPTYLLPDRSLAWVAQVSHPTAYTHIWDAHGNGWIWGLVTPVPADIHLCGEAPWVRAAFLSDTSKCRAEAEGLCEQTEGLKGCYYFHYIWKHILF